jgi:hypothetical protein
VCACVCVCVCVCACVRVHVCVSVRAPNACRAAYLAAVASASFSLASSALASAIVAGRVTRQMPTPSTTGCSSDRLGTFAPIPQLSSPVHTDRNNSPAELRALISVNDGISSSQPSPTKPRRKVSSVTQITQLFQAGEI